MEKLKFFDLRTKKPFMSDSYKIVKKKGRKFAVAINPKSKGACWRIMGKA